MIIVSALPRFQSKAVSANDDHLFWSNNSDSHRAIFFGLSESRFRHISFGRLAVDSVTIISRALSASMQATQAGLFHLCGDQTQKQTLPIQLLFGNFFGLAELAAPNIVSFRFFLVPRGRPTQWLDTNRTRLNQFKKFRSRKTAFELSKFSTDFAWSVISCTLDVPYWTLWLAMRKIDRSDFARGHNFHIPQLQNCIIIGNLRTNGVIDQI